MGGVTGVPESDSAEGGSLPQFLGELVGLRPASGISPGADSWQGLRAGRRGLCHNRYLWIWKRIAAHQQLSPVRWCWQAGIWDIPAPPGRLPQTKAPKPLVSTHLCSSSPHPTETCRSHPVAVPIDMNMASTQGTKPAWSTAALPILHAPSGVPQGHRPNCLSAADLCRGFRGPSPRANEEGDGLCSGFLYHRHQPWSEQETPRAGR